MIVSHNINLIVTLSSCVTPLLNLVTQIWKINLKYPGSSQPIRRHSDCETTTNRQEEYHFRLPRLAEPWQTKCFQRTLMITLIVNTFHTFRRSDISNTTNNKKLMAYRHVLIVLTTNTMLLTYSQNVFLRVALCNVIYNTYYVTWKLW